MKYSRFLLMSLEMQGYKGFVNTAKITLSDLTLVYGENSAGKSSIMRLLVSIAKAVKKRSQYPLLPVGVDRRDQNFSSLFTNNQSAPLKLTLFFENPSNGMAFKLEYVIQYIREKNLALITDFQVEDVHGIEWRYEIDTDYSPDSTFERKYSVTRNAEKVPADLKLEFHGLAPLVYYSKGCTEEIFEGLASAVENAYNALTELAHSIVWIGPLRNIPPRHSTLTCFPTAFSADGRETLQLLHPANPKGDAIVQRCSEWFESSTKRVLSVNPSVESNVEVFSVSLAPKEAPAMIIPIAEHGAGMSQVLPIVILCAAASLQHPVYQTTPLLIFENPELHLHDAVHERLAELFLLAAGKEGVRIVAETHSENVLLTTQIAELERSNTNKKTMSINWVRKNDQGHSEIDQFQFDENGSLGGLWSRNIFAYTPELVRRVMTLKLRKRAVGESNAN
jgi:hypothetical protein